MILMAVILDSIEEDVKAKLEKGETTSITCQRAYVVHPLTISSVSLLQADPGSSVMNIIFPLKNASDGSAPVRDADLLKVVEAVRRYYQAPDATKQSFPVQDVTKALWGPDGVLGLKVTRLVDNGSSELDINGWVFGGDSII